MDWIVQNLFGLPPLLDGHRAQQQRISSTGLNILRDICHAISDSGRMRESLTTGDIAGELEARGIDIPGKAKLSDDYYAGAAAIGRALGPLFRDVEMVEIDAFWVSRSVTIEAADKGRTKSVKHYRVTPKGEPANWGHVTV
jgi:hypothetical protein